MKMWPFVLLSALLLSGCTGVTPAAPSPTNTPAPSASSPSITPTATPNLVSAADMDQRIKTMWDRLDKTDLLTNKSLVVWKSAYSIWFPSDWSPTPNTTWVRYVYAQGMDLDLRDAVRVAQPWARLESRANVTTLVPLSTKLENTTVQGVSPLDATSQAVLAQENRIADDCLKLTALPTGTQATEIKTFYRTWLKYNGAFATLIRAKHEKFLAWVNE